MKYIIYILPIVFSISGCELKKMPNETKFSIRITSEPAAYDAIYLDIQQVEIQHSESIETGWVPITNFRKGIFNLLNYVHGNDTLIVSTDISPGKISQIRFILGTNNYLVQNGEIYPLEIPSGSTSGLKLNIQETLDAGVDNAIWIYFNSAKSIRLQASGEYLLKPVLRAYSLTTSGIIKGNIYPALSLPYIYIINSDDTISTFASSSGSFNLNGISAGTYSVYIEPIEPYLKKIIENVTVVNGESTDLGEISITELIENNTLLSIRLSGKPSSYLSVKLDIQNIQVNHSESGWVTLNNVTPGIYNLSDYINGNTSLLVSAEIAPGTISEIRLILGANNTVVTKDGTTHSLTIPSGSTSGIKINVTATIEQAIDNRLWINFDPDRSITVNGSGKYMLNPVMRVYSSATNGAIRGRVNPLEALPYVYVSVGNTETVGTSIDSFGNFYIEGIPGGTYSVNFTPLVPYVNKIIENVNVVNGESTNLGDVTITQ